MYKTVSFAMNYEPQLVIYSRISSIQDVFLYIYLGVFDVKFLTPIVSSAGGARLFPYGSSVTRNLEALVYQTLDMLRNLTHHLHPRKSTMAPEKSPFAIGDNTSSNNSCFYIVRGCRSKSVTEKACCLFDISVRSTTNS